MKNIPQDYDFIIGIVSLKVLVTLEMKKCFWILQVGLVDKVLYYLIGKCDSQGILFLLLKATGIRFDYIGFYQTGKYAVICILNMR